MHQLDHDFLGIIAAMTAFVHYWVPGASAVAAWIVRAAAALLDPLARADLGWISSQAQELVSELRGPGAVYVFQFWGVRFLLGLAEAGFYPGVIVYLTHWFPRRDRSRALAWFFIGTPIAQIIGPPICGAIMAIGVGGNPPLSGPGRLAVGLHLLGHSGRDSWVSSCWQGCRTGPTRPAGSTTTSVRRSKASCAARNTSIPPRPATCRLAQALAHPKVLALAAAYFFVVTGNYGVEMYMASILKDWYHLDVQKISWLVVIPAIGSLLGQIFVGWNSDRTHERRWHASLPIIFGAAALVLTPLSQGDRWLTIALFTLAMTGVEGLSAGLLDLAQRAHVGIGGGGQYWSDQLFRQPRRSGRSHRRRYRSRCHGLLQCRPPVSCRVDGHFGRDDHRPGHRPQGQG